jgi:hypothetical protein
VTEADANLRRKQCRRKVTLSPSEQAPLDPAPFNVTDGAWVRGLREQVCGPLAPWNRGRDESSAAGAAGGGAAGKQADDEECIVVKLQGHWEHWGLFYRYREFIKVLPRRCEQKNNPSLILVLSSGDLYLSFSLFMVSFYGLVAAFP